MFINIWISCVIAAAITPAAAHSPSETHTMLILSPQEIVAVVDLPWTVNDAAREYFNIKPGDRISDQETDAYLKQYIIAHFSVRTDDEKLAVRSIQAIPQDHGHSLVYRIRFTPTNQRIKSIHNTLMIGKYGNRQKNYIDVRTEEYDIKGLTTKAYSGFYLDDSVQPFKDSRHMPIPLYAIIGLIVPLIFFISKRPINSTTVRSIHSGKPF